MLGRIKRMLYTRAALLAISVVLAGIFLVNKVLYFIADPGKDKECDPLDPTYGRDDGAKELSQVSAPRWVQAGGVVNDASCLDETAVAGVIAVRSEDDIRNALAYARANGLKVSVAGVKHSMGGQAFAKGNIVLDMTGFNAVV